MRLCRAGIAAAVLLLAGGCKIEEHPAWQGSGTGSDGTDTGGGTSAGGTDGTGTTGSGSTTAADGSGTGGDDETTVLDDGPGLDLDIPDGSYDGSLGSMLCHTLSAPSTGFDVIQSVELQLGITHTWLGDLVIKLESPDGTVVTVISRAGTDEGSDDGAGVFSGGTEARLEASSPITFRDGAAVEAEDMGQGLQPNQVACQDDGICDHDPSPDSGPGVALADFAGDTAVGDWDVCVGDSGNNDSGTLDRVVLTLNKIQ